MKIITRAVLDIMSGRWIEEESHEYQGPLARCMPDALNLGDLNQVYPLVPSGVHASSPQTTGSGSWVDVSNWIGDMLLVVDVSANVGGYGSITVQLQSATANTGAAAANETSDPRNSGLLTITANGTFVMPYSADKTANKFVGVNCVYTTVTSATFGVTLLGRLQNN